MSDIRFDQIASAPSITTAAYFVGTFDNGDGTFTDYRYSYNQLLESLRIRFSKTIICPSDSATLVDVFFANPVSMIVTGTQTYILSVDYTQNTGTNTITGTTITFSTGQIILARL